MNKFKPNGETFTGFPEIKESTEPDVVIFSTGGGGAGKVIASTAIAKSIRDKHPNARLVVVTPHVHVYQSIGWVDEVSQAGRNPSFYERFHDSNFKWYQGEPYFHKDYISGRMHLLDAWASILGIERTSDPILHLTDKEIKHAKTLFNNVKNPCILFQSEGGSAPQQNQQGQFIRQKNYERDLPPEIMQQVVNALAPEYGFAQVLRKGQTKIQGAVHIEDADMRDLYSYVNGAQIILGIDSVVQHAAKALNKKAIVLWAATRPQCLGYESHVNLWRKACPTPLCNRPNSFLMDTSPEGRIWSCPYGGPCADHDVDNIISAIREY